MPMQPRIEDLPAVLATVEAAGLINRRPYTLRRWACYDNGPIRPVRINGRLAWRVADLLALLNGNATAETPKCQGKKTVVADHD